MEEGRSLTIGLTGQPGRACSNRRSMCVMWRQNKPVTRNIAPCFNAVGHPWSLAGNGESVVPLHRMSSTLAPTCACDHALLFPADQPGHCRWSNSENSTNEPNSSGNACTNAAPIPGESGQTKLSIQPMVGWSNPSHARRSNEATTLVDGWMDMIVAGQNEQNEATCQNGG
jgi:hypothetical protein